jgi:glutathione S-transferase
MLKILGQMKSINVRKAVWTADECGVEYKLDEAWGREQSLTSPEFLALNPNGQVPVLMTPDGPLWESNTICRFLANSSGREDLLPAGPLGKAQVERWMDWQATDLNDAWRPAFMARFRGGDVTSEEFEASRLRWLRAMTIASDALGASGPFLTGETFTLADIVVALSYQRWRHMDFGGDELSPLERWYDLVTGRPGFCRNLDRETP